MAPKQPTVVVSPDFAIHGNSEVRRCAALIVDIAGTVALRSQLGDDAAGRRIRKLLEAIIATSREYRGEFIKSYGDDVLAIFEHDPALLEGALARKVVLCSPCTLFAVLAVIRQAAETFRLQQRSREIVALLGGFGKQWAAFTEHMDRVGRRLDTLQKEYDAMTGVRRRQLERQLDRVEDVRRRDRIPAVEVLAGSDLELEAEAN